MIDALRVILGIALLTGAGTAAAAALKPRSFSAFVLAAYVLGWAWLVCSTFALSAVELVTPIGLLGSCALGLAAGTGAWLLRGRPRPPRRPSARAMGRLLRDPVLLPLALVAVLALAYTVAIALAVAPNEWDALTYHLARAAFWKQNHAVGLIAHADDDRLNFNPPNAEIGQLFVLTLDGGDRFVNLVQLSALLAMSLGVFAVGRRAGLEPRPALFGALTFLLLPLPLLQGSSALNDLVVGSFLVTAVCFLLSARSLELLLGGVALALALGTKFSAPLAFPVIAAIALAGPARQRWRWLLAVGAGSVAAGAYWYIVNVVETGRFDGGLAITNGQSGQLTPGWVAWRARQYLIGELQFPGGSDGGAKICVVTGLIVIALGFVPRWSRSRWTFARAGVLVAVLPLAGLGGTRLLEKTGATGSFYAHSADPVASWYGPVAALLLPLSLAMTARGLLRRGAPAVLLALTAAPLLFGVIMAASLSYDPWRGRFFVFSVALSAAVWGIALPRRTIATAVVALSAAVTLISLTDYLSKPSGIHLVHSLDIDGSIWMKSRLSEQLLLRRRDPGSQAIRFVASHVPANGHIALDIGVDDYVVPYFGSRYRRRVTFVDRSGPTVEPGTAWVVASSRLALATCDWDVASRLTGGWLVYKRSRRPCRQP